MGQFKPQYMTAYFIGEGLSGMLPGLVGLIQGVESEPECINETVIVTNETTGINTTEYMIIAEYPPPLFSVQVFFFFLFGMMVVSGTCFTLLHFHPFCKKERIKSSYNYTISEDSGNDNISAETKLDTYFSSTTYPEKYTQDSPTTFDNSISETVLTKKAPSVECVIGSKPLISTSQFVYLLILTGWLNALLNGVIPSTQSYTSLPYGSLAFTLAVRLSTVINPLMCLVALFFGTRSLIAVGTLSLIATGLTGWHLYLAAMSPYPPLKGTDAGTALVASIS
jgi:riboflavin transporter 2